jgi:ABC-2 type transport system ATP-binding protein
MILMENVSKTYMTSKRSGLFRKSRLAVEAVRELSLSIRPGEIVGLLGLNGAGKTTTIKMLSTLLEPTCGTITIDGLDIRTNRKIIQSRINVITGSERLLYWRLTGRENLTYFGRLYGLSEEQIRSRSQELLEEVGLMEAADLPVEQYSKGMKQRLQIARGLINDPSYILLDEPTIGLDAPVALHLRDLVRRMAVERGKGILLTSHYLQEVEELCSRVYVLNKGSLMLADTPQAIIRQTAGLERLELEASGQLDKLGEQLAAAFGMELGSICVTKENGPEKPAHLKGHSMEPRGTIAVQAEAAGTLAPSLLSWLSTHGVAVTRLSVVKPTLEEAILSLSRKGGAPDHAKLSASVPC